jgi:hypothetical protein
MGYFRKITRNPKTHSGSLSPRLLLFSKTILQ